MRSQVRAHFCYIKCENLLNLNFEIFMLTNYSNEIKHLLYEDESGELIGLDEVQLLEPIPSSRIPALQQLLNGEDLYLAYQATLILTAWGYEIGLQKTEEFIDERIDKIIEIAPHRIYGYDNVYDELAEAVGLFALSSNQLESERKIIFKKLLSLYGEMSFESDLKRQLLKSNFTELSPEVEQAVERAYNLGKFYLSSNLLHILGKWNSPEFYKWMKVFAKIEDQTPNPKFNVVESLEYLPMSDRSEIMNLLTKSSDQQIINSIKY